jgi:hypothetical protein
VCHPKFLRHPLHNELRLQVKDYDFSNPGWNPSTGHFTALVWRDTTRLGCAVNTQCSWATYVCQYGPPGVRAAGDAIVPLVQFYFPRSMASHFTFADRRSAIKEAESPENRRHVQRVRVVLLATLTTPTLARILLRQCHRRRLVN